MSNINPMNIAIRMQEQLYLVDLTNNYIQKRTGIANVFPEKICNSPLHNLAIKAVKLVNMYLRDDMEFVSKLPRQLFNEYEFCKKIVEINGLYLKYTPYISDYCIGLKAIKQNPRAFLYLSNCLRKEKYFNELVVEKFADEPEFINPIYYNDRKIMMKMFKYCKDVGHCIVFLHSSLKRDLEMINYIIQTNKNTIDFFFHLLDWDIQLEIINTINLYNVTEKMIEHVNYKRLQNELIIKASEIMVENYLARKYWEKVWKNKADIMFVFI